MKTLFKFGCLFILGMSILGFIIGGIATCSNNDLAKDFDSLSQDSLESPTKIIAKSKINIDSVVKVFRPDFTFKKDEFNNTMWVEPKNRPKYVDVNSVFAYFELNNDVPKNFRFCVQYTADEWLFIQQIIFNVDGHNFTYTPHKMERDNKDYIWEWCDDAMSLTDEEMIKGLGYGKSVKMKLEGRQYYKVRSLTQSEIHYLKKTYDFYKALGGTFYE